ncbi:MAG: PepSY-associated TM helix domain-containing protein [Bacteriovoracia bacterium]
MKPSAEPPVRRFSRWLHRWFGLTVGVVFVLLGLSGSYLAYRDVWGPAFDDQPSARSGELAREFSLAEWVKTARAESGLASDPLSVRLPEQPGRALEVTFNRNPGAGGPGGPGGNDPWAVYLDPATGAYLGATAPRETFTGVLYAFHHDLFLGSTGKTALAGIGWTLMVLLAVGLLLAWPRTGGWRGLLQKPSFSNTSIFHTRFGIYSLGLLAIVTGSGAFIARSDWFLGPRPVPPSVRSGSKDTGGMDFARFDAALAREAIPVQGAWIRRDRRTGAWTVSTGQGEGDSLRRYRYDPGTGALAQEVPTAPRGGRAVGVFLHDLHEGKVGGPLGRALIFLSGWLPLAFYGTGVLIWWRRRAGQGRRAATLGMKSRLQESRP